MGVGDEGGREGGKGEVMEGKREFDNRERHNLPFHPLFRMTMPLALL